MVTEEMLALVEMGLGFKLYQWQRDALLGLKPDMTLVPPRRSGRTTLFMLELALSEGPSFTVSGLRGPGGYYTAPREEAVELPVDYPSSAAFLRGEYKKWFARRYMDICHNLRDAGLRPRWIRGFYNSKF